MYKRQEKIIEVAKKLNANAIHPGYGFMAENAEFAQNVIDSGIIWMAQNQALSYQWVIKM